MSTPSPKSASMPAAQPARPRAWLALGLLLLASFAASAIGGLATAANVRTWYPTLVKPDWNPPSWVFGPVWTLLYILMAVAAWRVWRRRDVAGARAALLGHGLQLVLNAAWSLLFFGLHNPGAALIEIVVLWALLAWLFARFRRIDPVAGWLWLPYLLWVSFATILNATIWYLN